MLGAQVDQLSGRLFLSSLVGETNAELCVFNDKRELRTTSRYDALEAAVREAGITFIALDNVAHLFSGNENARNEVASFVALMNRLAAKCGGSVLFIGHPNKAGDSFSGSTAWINQVRSFMFMETPRGRDDEEPADRDARIITREKANYGRNGSKLKFRWHEWAFAREEDLPFSVSEESRARIENEAFLACLAKATAERRAVSASNSASNYAPKVFARMPSAGLMRVDGFERALARLLDNGAIVNGAKVYKRDNRSWVTGLGVVPGTEVAEDPFG